MQRLQTLIAAAIAHLFPLYQLLAYPKHAYINDSGEKQFRFFPPYLAWQIFFLSILQAGCHVQSFLWM